MAKRQTIPIERDYLGAILDRSVDTASEPPARVKREVPPAAAQKPAEPVRKLGFRLSESLCEEIRDCVVFLQGPPLHLTVSQFGEEACRRELERLKTEHNGGRDFPTRGSEPRTGRAVG